MLRWSSQSITGTILVADDEESNRELLEELLSREGFEVVTAADGLSALQELNRLQPDLVLLDVLMPRMSGLDVCEKIQRLI
jgi:CheY-like chemotaxis protein